MKRKVELEYYYRVDGCRAKDSDDPVCICWHKEGDGPCKDERHDSEVPVVSWRIKPANPKLTGLAG